MSTSTPIEGENAAPFASLDDAKAKIELFDKEHETLKVPDARFTVRLLLAWVVSMMCTFQMGVNIAVSGSVKEQDVFPGHSSFQWSVCVSIFPVGAFLGATLSGPVGTVWSRRSAVFLMAIVFIVSGLIMMFAANIYMLMVGRFVVGLAAGANTVFIPLYHRELSAPNNRGTLGTGYMVACTLGILFGDVLAFAFSGTYHGISQPGWRLLLGFSTVLGVIQLLLMPFVPETASWLLGAGRDDDAAAALQLLRGTSDVTIELQSLRESLEEEAQEAENQVTMMAVLRDRSVRRPLVIGCMLQTIQQLCGINAVMFYANRFFEDAGLENPQVGTALVGLVNFLSTFMALALMDRAGRRLLMIWSCAGMLVAQIVLTLALLKVLPIATVLSVIGVLAFVAFFELGLGPVSMLIMGEMMPPAPRATGMSIAMMHQWFFTFFIGLIYPSMQEGLDKLSFVPFTIFLAFALGFTLQCVPETKGMTVEEIREEMDKRKHGKKTAKTDVTA